MDTWDASSCDFKSSSSLATDDILLFLRLLLLTMLCVCVCFVVKNSQACDLHSPLESFLGVVT